MQTKLSDAWKRAREINQKAKKTPVSDLQREYGTGAVSEALRAWPRAKAFGMIDVGFSYKAVCATLSISDIRFKDFLECMNITPDLPVRQIRNRAAAYKKHCLELPEPEPIRTDLDYIVINGKRFWIVPEKVSEFKKLLEDQADG